MTWFDFHEQTANKNSIPISIWSCSCWAVWTCKRFVLVFMLLKLCVSKHGHVMIKILGTKRRFAFDQYNGQTHFNYNQIKYNLRAIKDWPSKLRDFWSWTCVDMYVLLGFNLWIDDSFTWKYSRAFWVNLLKSLSWCQCCPQFP